MYYSQYEFHCYRVGEDPNINDLISTYKPVHSNVSFSVLTKKLTLRPCFFGWLKQFNHSHPPFTNFNQLQPLLSTTKFHCNHSQPTSTNFTHLSLKETYPKFEEFTWFLVSEGTEKWLKFDELDVIWDKRKICRSIFVQEIFKVSL